MRICRFSTGEEPRFGVVTGEVDEFGQPAEDSVVVALAGDPLYVGIKVLEEQYALSDVRLLAPIIPRSKVVGIGLIAIGILLPGNRKARSERANDGAATRVSRWRARAMGVDAAGGGAGALVGLALAAATVEAASMLPYLAAIGMLSTSPLPMTGRAVVLVGYCLLMIAPALVLLALRLGLGSRVEPTLRRLAAWMERQSGETVAWILAIMGVLILRGAVWG